MLCGGAVGTGTIAFTVAAGGMGGTANFAARRVPQNQTLENKNQRLSFYEKRLLEDGFVHYAAVE